MQSSAVHSYTVFPTSSRPARRRPGAKRRRRLVTLSLLFVLLVAAVTLVLFPRLGATLPRSEAAAVVAYTVVPGDTLWQIAAASGGSHDTRLVIEAIKETNHLQTVTLQPGQQLLIPQAFR